MVKKESDFKEIAMLRGKKVNAAVLLKAFSTVIHKKHMVGRTNNIETNNKFTCWTIKQEIFKILREHQMLLKECMNYL